MVVRLRPRLAFDLVLFVGITLLVAATHALLRQLGAHRVETLLVLVLGFIIFGARRLLRPVTLRLGERGLIIEKGVVFQRRIELRLRDARRARAEPVPSIWGDEPARRWSCAVRSVRGDVLLASWLAENETKWLAFLINKYLRVADAGTEA